MKGSFFRPSSPWPWLLGFGFAFVFLLLALTAPTTFQALWPLLLLSGGTLLLLGLFWDFQRKKRWEEAFTHYLSDPCPELLEVLKASLSPKESSLLMSWAQHMQEQKYREHQSAQELLQYREFIESWVHEVKTPLSLFSLLLSNYASQWPNHVEQRMDYVRQQLQDQVDRILFYARLTGDHPDYRFEEVDLRALLEEILTDWAPLLAEKKVSLTLDVPHLMVLTDRRILPFLIRQIVSNALKFAPKGTGRILLEAQKPDQEAPVVLRIHNNGPQVRSEDAPFIFDKGFTGIHAQRQKSSGLGLYFVRKYSELLGLQVSLDPLGESSTGFALRLSIPTRDPKALKAPLPGARS
ncbi:hypothetical protein ABB02_00301 [Clostridiaceae bacterium JG1575]|nr:hypothetical protein ABB02_00301 [Clostridiaceae bacterium JG1575]